MVQFFRTVVLCGLLVGVFADAATAQVPRARQGLLSLEDARLFYEVVGSGEDPIIVVHGGPGLDHSYLQPGLDVLAVRHTLVYYDQRATGRSTSGLDSVAINLDTFVEDIDALRQALGYERISVLTHSFGALIGLEYALRHPENLRSLILLNPVEPGTQFREETADRQSRARTVADSTELAELTSTEGFAARDAATLSQVFRVVFRQSLRDRERISELELNLMPATAKNGQDVAGLLGGGMQPIDWWDRLPEVQAPTLVLHGRYDVLPVSMSSALAAALRNGSLEVLDSGHFAYLEDPVGLLEAVSGFIAGLDR